MKPNKSVIMNKQDKKDMFIELRIKGETFEKIAKELGVSKQTLINWSKEDEVKVAIDIAHSMRVQSILDEYKLLRNNKIEYYSILAKKIKDELDKSDFSDFKTEKLIDLLLKFENRISELAIKKTFGGENLIDDWSTKGPTFDFDPED